MASIVLSFVGEQDPCSFKTDQEGSIITMLRYLLQENCAIAKVILMHTSDTATRAKETQEWIEIHDGLNVLSGKVELISVSEGLSEDPTDLLLAAQEARKGLERVQASLQKGDRIEFNASSGTPAMKSSLSILQAAGYAPESRVWQIRNPSRMTEGQSRVFETDVGVLRREFDLKVIKKQVSNYNYGGAIFSLQESTLATDILSALLKYGQCRMNFDFNGAFSAIQPFVKTIKPQLSKDIAALRQKNLNAIAKEIYFNALIKYQNQQYSDFLVEITQFQECTLTYLIESKLKLDIPDQYSDTYRFWEDIKYANDGKLYKYLQEIYEEKNWELSPKGFPKRPVLIGLLSYYAEFLNTVIVLEELNEYCDQRNRRMHKFEGASEIEDAEKLLSNLRSILKIIIKVPDQNPFDTLNHEIISLLDDIFKKG